MIGPSINVRFPRHFAEDFQGLYFLVKIRKSLQMTPVLSGMMVDLLVGLWFEMSMYFLKNIAERMKCIKVVPIVPFMF